MFSLAREPRVGDDVGTCRQRHISLSIIPAEDGFLGNYVQVKNVYTLQKQDGLLVSASLCFVDVMLLFEFIGCEEQRPT